MIILNLQMCIRVSFSRYKDQSPAWGVAIELLMRPCGTKQECSFLMEFSGFFTFLCYGMKEKRRELVELFSLFFFSL